MQEPLTDSQSPHGSVSRLDDLLKIPILQKKAKQTGHILKRDYLLHRYCSCKYNNKQHIWAMWLRPHTCLLMASQVTRWLKSIIFLAVVSLLAISVLRCISWGTLCSKKGVYSYMKISIKYIKYRETNVLSWINVTLWSSLLLFLSVISVG